MRMTAAQILALDGIIADNAAITDVELQNTSAGVIVKTNRHKIVGNLMSRRYFLIAGNGRVMDGRDFQYHFDFRT